MSSDLALTITFTLILLLAVILKVRLKKQVAVGVTLGVGALLLMGISIVLNNTTVPAWMLGASGIVLLADAWYSYKKSS